MTGNLTKAVAIGTLCSLLLFAPPPAAARVTVTIEVTYGGVVACGLGFFLYLGGSWEVPFAAGGLQGALFEISAGQAHLGVPAPSLGLVGDPSGERVQHDIIHFDLLRWRF